MAEAEPEPEAEEVADATATIGTDRSHVDLQAGRHALAADEPAEQGGADTGPPPFGLLPSGLGACTAITLRGSLGDDQQTRLVQIAEKTPVTRAVRAGTEIRTTVERA
jgi:putative redox protein